MSPLRSLLIFVIGTAACRTPTPRTPISDNLRDDCFLAAEPALVEAAQVVWGAGNFRGDAAEFVGEPDSDAMGVYLYMDDFWKNFWKMYGVGALRVGDVVLAVDGCRTTDMVFYARGGFDASPRKDRGYLTKLEFLLVAPRARLAGKIRQAIILRGGNRIVLKVESGQLIERVIAP